MSLLAGSLRFGLLVGWCAALAAGCGGLRQRPITSTDGGPVGAGGSSAGAYGLGGLGGSFGGGGAGGTTVVDGGGDAPSCTAGAPCVPTSNPCHKGQFVCMEGVMSCMELPDLQANGTSCDIDKVCHNGSCDSCVADMACDVTGRPCRVGSIVCTTGAPVCTETDNKPNGTACGNGMVCQNGTCATCQANASCQPTNRCHNGTQVCTPSIACNDANTNVAAGAACGADMVCDGRGTCVACAAGSDCAVPGKPCSKGTTACNTGAPVCIESGNAPNGTACGTNKVCSNGVCNDCSAGSACVPGNACHGGITVCTPTIGCTDTGNPLSNGQSCGAGKVCNGGNCVACSQGDTCQPSTACRTGMITCVTGSPVCSETGSQPNGTPCNTGAAGMVCNGGSCVACMSGSCVPTSNPCHTGTLSCSTGTSTCNDTGQNAPDGTGCGPNLVCRTGMCVSCMANQPCQPTNQCKTGTTVCTSGMSVCTETGNKGAGALCGAGQSCANGLLTLQGVCTANGTCSNGTMQCPSGTCNAAGSDCATCPNGQTSCPMGCTDLTRDQTNCGRCDNICPAPAAGTGIPICVNSTCDVQCNTGYLACDPGLAMCQRTLWDFEDGLIAGWKILSPTAGAVSGKPMVTQNGGHNSKLSLAVPIDATGTGATRQFLLGPPICQGKGVQGKGFTVTAFMMLVPGTPLPPMPGRPSHFGVVVTTESGDHETPTLIQNVPGYNVWFKVQTSVPDGTQLIQIAVEGLFAVPDTGLNADWMGTVLIDDVSIN